MVALNFDATSVAPNAGFEPLPTGWYNVMITDSEIKPTKKGDGSFLQLSAQVQGGEHNGKKTAIRLNLNNQNQTAVDIANGELSAICHVTGVMQLQDSQQLHGRPFQIMIKKVERQDKPGEFGNEVGGYRDINGNEPGMAGNAGTQQTAAPAWAGQGGGQQPPQAQAPAQMQQPPQTQQVPANNGQPPANGQQGAAPPWTPNANAGGQPQQQAPQTQQGTAPPWGAPS